jgi:hypothetical protein
MFWDSMPLLGNLKPSLPREAMANFWHPGTGRPGCNHFPQGGASHVDLDHLLDLGRHEAAVDLPHGPRSGLWDPERGDFKHRSQALSLVIRSPDPRWSLVAGRLLVIGPDSSLAERRPEVAHVLLRLPQQRSQCSWVLTQSRTSRSSARTRSISTVLHQK